MEFNQQAALVIDVLKFARESQHAFTSDDVQRRFSMCKRTARRYMHALEECGCIRVVDPASGNLPALWSVHQQWRRGL